MKTCSLCKIEKDLDLFSFRSDRKDVKNSWCKDCVNKYNRYKKYFKKENIERDIPEDKKCNSCGVLKKNTEFYKNKRNKTGLRSSCKECDSKSSKKYNQYNKDMLSIRNKEYYLNNLEYHKDRNKKYKNENRDILSEYNKNYKMKRSESDDFFKFTCLIRKRINSYMKNGKNKKTEDIISCSFEFFKSYLESKFEIWMNWDNYGKYNGEYDFGWDIDHIIPLSSVDNIDELIELNHYTNLRPLCSKVNRYEKRDKI